MTAQVAPRPFAALRLQADFSATGRTSGDTVPATLLTDAYVEFAPPTAGTVRPALVVGQFKTPFSLEFLTPFSLLQTANRSGRQLAEALRRDGKTVPVLFTSGYSATDVVESLGFDPELPFLHAVGRARLAWQSRHDAPRDGRQFCSWKAGTAWQGRAPPHERWSGERAAGPPGLHRGGCHDV